MAQAADFVYPLVKGIRINDSIIVLAGKAGSPLGRVSHVNYYPWL